MANHLLEDCVVACICGSSVIRMKTNASIIRVSSVMSSKNAIVLLMSLLANAITNPKPYPGVRANDHIT